MLYNNTISVNNSNNPTGFMRFNYYVLEFERCVLRKYISIKYFVSTDQNDITSIQSRPK